MIGGYPGIDSADDCGYFDNRGARGQANVWVDDDQFCSRTDGKAEDGADSGW
jgi:hypothetical protein